MASYIERFKTTDDLEAIAQLGTELRDKETRDSEEIFQLIPDICAKFLRYADVSSEAYGPKYLHNIQRAMINLAANSDRNREALISSDIWGVFFETIHSHLEEERIVSYDSLSPWNMDIIFLAQFIRGTSKGQEWAAFFLRHSLDRIIVARLRLPMDPLEEKLKERSDALYESNYEGGSPIDALDDEIEELKQPMYTLYDFDVEFELYLELSKVGGIKLNDMGNDLLLILKLSSTYADSLRDHHYDDDDFNPDEILETTSTITLNLTSVEDLNGDGTDLTECEELVHSILRENEATIKSIVVKRQLFATSGNISSMPSFANGSMHADCVVDIESPYTRENPYLIAASGVILGNNIDGVEARDREVSGLPAGFVEKFCQRLSSFNDVVQYQALHFLVNLSTPEVASEVFFDPNNLRAIYKTTKAIIDNKNYYPEIYSILVKYVKRSIRLLPTEKKKRLLELADYWMLFDKVEKNEDVLLVLLQNLIHDKQLPDIPQDTVASAEAQAAADHVSVGSETATTAKAAENSNVRISSSSSSLISILFENMVKPMDTIELDILLEKLKTLGMAFQCSNFSALLRETYREEPQLRHNILTPYLKFLEGLQAALVQGNSDAGTAPPAILVNNSKFVATATKSYGDFLGENSLIINVCNDILGS